MLLTKLVISAFGQLEVLAVRWLAVCRAQRETGIGEPVSAAVNGVG
jgi:hypothetical protein